MPDAIDNLQSLSSLTVANATAALARGLAAIQAGQTAFDLRHVLAVDSAAVAVLLAWQKAAKTAGFELELKHLPPALQSLTKLYGVCSLLFPTSVALEGSAPADNPAHAEFAPVKGGRSGAKLGLAGAPDEQHHHHH